MDGWFSPHNAQGRSWLDVGGVNGVGRCSCAEVELGEMLLLAPGSDSVLFLGDLRWVARFGLK